MKEQGIYYELVSVGEEMDTYVTIVTNKSLKDVLKHVKGKNKI